MKFSEVIGKEDVKQRLLRQLNEGRQPHALLLSGPEGSGGLAMALALGTYLLCERRGPDDSCGECPSCRQIGKYGHPDLHFSFPIIRKSETTTCDDYMPEWNAMIREGAYFGLNDWIERTGAEGKQALIPDAEGDNILRKLSLTSYGGGYKVLIMWQPERLTASAANNLLKFLEEPTPLTVFILVSADASRILPTLLSRTQQIEMSPLSVTTIAAALKQRNGLSAEAAMEVARRAGGSYLAALRHISIDDESKVYFEQFVSLMRMAWARDVRGLSRWADEVSTMGRERQKSLLQYMQYLIRENFIYNFHQSELTYMTDEESAFALKFARFINERNVIDFMNELSQAQRDVEQNVNAKILFFSFALKLTVCIRK